MASAECFNKTSSAQYVVGIRARASRMSPMVR